MAAGNPTGAGQPALVEGLRRLVQAGCKGSKTVEVPFAPDDVRVIVARAGDRIPGLDPPRGLVQRLPIGKGHQLILLAVHYEERRVDLTDL